MHQNFQKSDQGIADTPLRPVGVGVQFGGLCGARGRTNSALVDNEILELLRGLVMSYTLSDEWPQRCIADFISEAKLSARDGRGFASMVTIFTVVLAVSESVFQKKTKKGRGQFNDGQLIEEFVKQMPDKSSWFIWTGASMSDTGLAYKLTEVRNGLAHALSVPEDVGLINSVAHLQMNNKDRLLIGTTQFVDAVEATVDKLTKNNPSVVFDPLKKGSRGPAGGQTISISVITNPK